MRKIIFVIFVICAAAFSLPPVRAAAATAAALPAPSVKAAVKGSDSVAVSWNSIKGAEKYVVYILYPDDKKYTKLVTTAKTTYKKTGLAAGTRYKFKVAAVDVADTKSVTGAFSKAVSATTDLIDFEKLFENQTSDVPVNGEGEVTKLLTDDSEGARHQRFILKLTGGQTLLITHNIDIAPRLDTLQTGDTVIFSGEYVWNDKGGLVHWTHHDPDGSHKAGYLKLNGKTYQ